MLAAGMEMGATGPTTLGVHVTMLPVSSSVPLTFFKLVRARAVVMVKLAIAVVERQGRRDS
jgi:hypothetical protein